ncbi:hypothetical protein UFOVP455_34 [uncultured Caudovirales phage]|uniref:Uncharacterized protein n=1 Tax=uncultured Caudovirales phage TaxID=2100421 RepID=A0A6J5MER3_9CAUD|nr:hypothetical protein UFOVP455_34 [uncultured Caudovirales phage]
MSKKEELYKALLEQVKELCTFYWESDDPRSNPLSFEIGAVEAIMYLIQDEERKEKDFSTSKTKGKK